MSAGSVVATAVPAESGRPAAPAGPVVVIGAGQAGAQFVDALRRTGHAGPLLLVGDDPQLPYQRPPLSKQYLADSRAADWLDYRPRDFYARHDVQLRLGRAVVEIDRRASRLRLDDGTLLSYERLAIATGTRVRRLAVPGSGVDRVHYLRTLADADALRAQLGAARRVVIVGGGFIGLEVAAVLAQAQRQVVVLEAAPRLLPRVAAPALAAFLHEAHRSHGVQLQCGAAVAAIEARGARGQGAPLTVLTADGTAHPADLVIAGVGVLPNVELAAEAGLQCDDGIVVDAAARTSDPAIVAAGDCTRHPNAKVGAMLRLETVHNAVEQAKVAALTSCGLSAHYDQTPWVWSDQYGFRLQFAGIAEGYDRHVVRGAVGDGRFSVCYFRGERFVALQAVNRPAEFAAARRLLNSGAALSPQQAADPNYDLGAAGTIRRRLEFPPGWAQRRRAPATGATTT